MAHGPEQALDLGDQPATVLVTTKNSDTEPKTHGSEQTFTVSNAAAKLERKAINSRAEAEIKKVTYRISQKGDWLLLWCEPCERHLGHGRSRQGIYNLDFYKQSSFHQMQLRSLSYTDMPDDLKSNEETIVHTWEQVTRLGEGGIIERIWRKTWYADLHFAKSISSKPLRWNIQEHSMHWLGRSFPPSSEHVHSYSKISIFFLNMWNFAITKTSINTEMFVS